ncbi:hypothetical protein ACFL52_05160, partial [Candidatus Margulisiibacteriota bacterium]
AFVGRILSKEVSLMKYLSFLKSGSYSVDNDIEREENMKSITFGMLQLSTSATKLLLTVFIALLTILNYPFPANAIELNNNGVKFDLFIDGKLWNSYQTLESGRFYNILIDASKDNIELNQIEIVNHREITNYYKYHGPHWFSKRHEFSIITTNGPGVYHIKFKGNNDKEGDTYFSAWLEIIDSNKLEAEIERIKNEKKARSSIISFSEKEVITFPKEFESETIKNQFYTHIGMVLGSVGAFSAYNSFYMQKSLADLFTAIPMSIIGGVFVGALIGANIDNYIYANSDICWLKSTNKSILTHNNIIYLKDSHDVFTTNKLINILGTINKGEFRKILEEKHAGDSTLFKVKRSDNPIFYLDSEKNTL